MKRNIFLKVVLFFSLFLMFNISKVNAATLEQLQAQYPNGGKWTGGGECAGFAAKMYNEYYGFSANAFAEKKYSLNDIQGGDIVRYTGNMAHSVWIVRRYGDKVDLAEANYDLNNGIRWRYNVSIYEFSNLTHVQKAPYVLGNTPPVLSAPNNIKAERTSIGMKFSWDAVDKSTGFLVKIYKVSDVDKGNFNNPIVSQNVENYANAQHTTTYIDISQEGQYYVFVHTKQGYNISPNGGSPARFENILINRITFNLDRTEFTPDEFKIDLNTKYYPENATNTKITYSSSNTGVATVSTDGKITMQGKGTATITAKSQNGVTCSKTIKVVDGKMARAVYLNKYSVTVKERQTTNLTATVYPADTTNKTITWSSEDESIAKVDSNGKITGINVGKTGIYAKCGSASTRCNVTVTEGDKLFKDVEGNEWFYGSVEYVSKKGLMNGYTQGAVAGNFGPNDNITRGQIVTILYRNENSPATSGNMSFSDVTNSGMYYYNPIKWASQKGIVTGYKEGVNKGKFLPDNPITREEFAIILKRYAAYKGKNTSVSANLNGFGDYKTVSAWAENEMKWAVGTGIISGNKDTNVPTLKPQGNATRAEAATMITRFCEKIIK